MLHLFLFLYIYYVFLFGLIPVLFINYDNVVCFLFNCFAQGGACLRFAIYAVFIIIIYRVCCIKLIKRAFVGRVLIKLYKM